MNRNVLFVCQSVFGLVGAVVGHVKDVGNNLAALATLLESI